MNNQFFDALNSEFDRVGQVLIQRRGDIEKIKDRLPDILAPDTHLSPNEAWGVYTFYDIPREIEHMKLLFDFQMFLNKYGKRALEKYEAGIYTNDSPDLFIDFMQFRQFNEKVLEASFQEFKKAKNLQGIRHRRGFKYRGGKPTKEEAHELASKIASKNEYESTWVMQNGYHNEFNPTPGDDYDTVNKDLNLLVYETYREIDKLKKYEEYVRKLTINHLLNVEKVKIEASFENNKEKEIEFNYDEIQNDPKFSPDKYKFYSHEDIDKKIIHCDINESKANEEKRKIVENIEHYKKILDEQVYGVDNEKLINAGLDDYQFKIEDEFLNHYDKIEIFKIILDVFTGARKSILDAHRKNEKFDVRDMVLNETNRHNDSKFIDLIREKIRKVDYKAR